MFWLKEGSVRNDRAIVGLLIAGFLILYTIIVFNFMETEGESRLVFLFLLALPVVVLLITMPRAALVVLALAIYFVRWIYDAGLVPREVTWLADIMIVIVVVRGLTALLGRREPISRIEKMIIALLAFAALSSIVNALDRTTIIAGFRIGFRYIALFFAIYQLNITEQWLKRFMVLMFGIGLVQTPIIIEQFSRLRWNDPDRLSGSFGWGQTPGVALFLLMLFAFLLARMLEQNRFRVSYLLLIGWMSISPVLGEAKFYFMFMPLLIVVMLRAELFKRPVVSVGILLMGLVLLTVVDYAVVASGGWRAGRNPFTFVRRLPEQMERDMELAATGRFERAYKYTMAVRLAAASPRAALLGNGPGSITESYLSPENTASQEYFARFGLSSIDTPSVPWLLTEYGFAGILMIYGLLWMIFRRGRTLRLAEAPSLRIWGRHLEAITVLFGAWMFYQSAWQTDAMNFAFWPLAGILVRLSDNEQQRQWTAKSGKRDRITEAQAPDRQLASDTAPAESDPR